MLTLTRLNTHKFSRHSFRSGGATFAFECGVPAKLIKAQGDWLFDAYFHYIRVDWTVKWVAICMLLSSSDGPDGLWCVVWVRYPYYWDIQLFYSHSQKQLADLLYNFYYMFKYKGETLPIGIVIHPRVWKNNKNLVIYGQFTTFNNNTMFIVTQT